MKHITKENIDQWMFQNIEGELSEAEVEQLHSFLVSNPTISEEAYSWGEAHMRDIEIEEFKKIDTIIREKRFVWRDRHTFFLGLLLGACIWIPFSFTGNTNSMVNNISTVKTKTLLPKNEKATLPPSPVFTSVKKKENIEDVSQTVSRSRKNWESIKTKDSFINVEMVSKPIKEEIYLMNPVLLREITKSQVKRRKPRKVYVKPFKTKKEIRKEKRVARRNARKPSVEYMKGKGPGVIPMNNFGF